MTLDRDQRDLGGGEEATDQDEAQHRGQVQEQAIAHRTVRDAGSR